MKKPRNKPYKKIYKDGELQNPIEGNYPQPHQNRRQLRQAGKYVILNNPITGAFVGRLKVGGNNRKPNRKGKRSFA